MLLDNRCSFSVLRLELVVDVDLELLVAGLKVQTLEVKAEEDELLLLLVLFSGCFLEAVLSRFLSKISHS